MHSLMLPNGGAGANHNTWNLELCIIVDLYLYTLPTNHFLLFYMPPYKLNL